MQLKDHSINVKARRSETTITIRWKIRFVESCGQDNKNLFFFFQQGELGRGGLRRVEISECGNWGVWKLGSVEIGECGNWECGNWGVWKMRSAENEECRKCGVLKMKKKKS